ncbi:MAG: DNA-binding response regulator [Clostridiales bacterium]|jgi:DNA-binding NarL/FixJ family response regulator|nr:DNA-binding response regulator [Clostridiales bacterium]
MRVLIIDDDKLVSMSLRTILEASGEIDVVAVGSSGTEAIKLYEKFLPDVLLSDIRMEGMSGIEASEQILNVYKDARILLLTTFSDDEYIVKALKLGVKGYILKQNFESIVPAIRAVYMGQSVFGDDIITKIPLFMQSNNKAKIEEYGLSEKEYEIIELVAEGLSNKEMALKLYLSEGTVRNYISIVLDKLALRDRTQLAIFYYKRH